MFYFLCRLYPGYDIFGVMYPHVSLASFIGLFVDLENLLLGKQTILASVRSLLNVPLQSCRNFFDISLKITPISILDSVCLKYDYVKYKR